MKKYSFMILVVVFACSIAVHAQVRNIVLVHGAFADGSGWHKVYIILKAKGYNVSIVGNPNTGIAEDIAATRRVLDRQNGKVLLVGHSYGGAIITEIGNAPNVAGLVYVAAFSPDKDETLGQLLHAYPVDPLSGILPPVDGFSWYDKEKFHAGFCADLPKEEAAFLADAQVPVAVSAFQYPFQQIAWKMKPSWHIVAREDHSLPVALQQFMGKRSGGKVFEIKGSHLLFISRAKEVADIIDSAAKTAIP
jgi:pimeloyl-ACP methyl ester carboxylesterase